MVVTVQYFEEEQREGDLVFLNPITKSIRSNPSPILFEHEGNLLFIRERILFNALMDKIDVFKFITHNKNLTDSIKNEIWRNLTVLKGDLAQEGAFGASYEKTFHLDEFLPDGYHS